MACVESIIWPLLYWPVNTIYPPWLSTQVCSHTAFLELYILQLMQRIVDALWAGLGGAGVSWVGFYVHDYDHSCVVPVVKFVLYLHSAIAEYQY